MADNVVKYVELFLLVGGSLAAIFLVVAGGVRKELGKLFAETDFLSEEREEAILELLDKVERLSERVDAGLKKAEEVLPNSKEEGK